MPCSQPGPAATVQVPMPTPANIEIVSGSFGPMYPSVGQGGTLVLVLKNTGGQGVDVVISGKVFRAGTTCPVEGYFRQVTAYIGPGEMKVVNVPYDGTFVCASWIDWSANAETCWQAGSAYGWLDILVGIDYYPDQQKHYTLRNAIKLPDC